MLTLLDYIARKTSRSPTCFQSLLRLELGVSLFVKKQYNRYLIEELNLIAKEEYSHAAILSSITGESIPEYRNIQEKNSVSIINKNRYQIDGISNKYLASLFLFSGKCADSFSLQDKLVFMTELEKIQTWFYSLLMNYCPTEYYQVLRGIQNSEASHAIILDSLISRYGASKIQVLKWRIKIALSVFIYVLEISFKK